MHEKDYVGYLDGEDLNGFEGVHRNVLAWAKARGLLDGTTTLDQFGKLLEEVNELYVALRKETRLMVEGSNKSGVNAWEMTVPSTEIKDAIGDIMVVLTIIAHRCSMSLPVCYAHAYDQIKNRKGQMVNGVFVKEENDND